MYLACLSGFTPERYKKFKDEETKKKEKKKNLGRMGPTGFQNRSFQSFQEASERGEASHLMPVTNAQKWIKSGELKPEDIPVSSVYPIQEDEYAPSLLLDSHTFIRPSSTCNVEDDGIIPI